MCNALFMDIIILIQTHFIQSEVLLPTYRRNSCRGRKFLLDILDIQHIYLHTHMQRPQVPPRYPRYTTYLFTYTYAGI